MAEMIATVSSKNQVTLPAEVRRRLGIHPSDKISFILVEDGTVEIRPTRFTIEAIIGSVKALPNQSGDFESEIEEAIAAEIERKQGRGSRH